MEYQTIFKDINNEGIYDNFFGVFPSNKINKFAILEKLTILLLKLTT